MKSGTNNYSLGRPENSEISWKFRTLAECVEALRRHTYLRLGFNGRRDADLNGSASGQCKILYSAALTRDISSYTCR